MKRKTKLSNGSTHLWVLGILLLSLVGFSACTAREIATMVTPTAQAVSPVTQRQVEETRPTCDFTRNMTSTPRPTRTPTPPPTPEATAVSISINDAITDLQRARLIKAAQNYISPDPDSAEETVQKMDYAKGATTSLTCGPLAFAILQDAGFISPYFTLNDTWLVSPLPGKNETLFREIFPLAHYEWLRDTTPMAEMDFAQNPLLAGDFIYTFGGNYEHMFVVTRVDETGRAYTVQNIEQGYLNGSPDDITFIIEETLLYDPNQPGEGVIYQWADPFFWKLGLTGIDGYQRFRPITPIAEPTAAQLNLAARIDTIITQTGGKWNISIETLAGNPLYERRPDESIHPASIIKVAIAAGTMQYLEDYSDGDDLETVLQRGPVYNTTENDRSYQQLLRAMLVLSEESAADILHENLRGSPLDEYAMLNDWGLPGTSFRPRKSTARELNELYRQLYQNTLVSPQASQLILDWMVEYTPNDDLRLGRLKEVLGDDAVMYNKRGSLLSPQLIVADSLILEYDGEVYLLQVFAYQDQQNSTIYETLEAAIGEIAVEFGEWLLVNER